MKTYPKANRPMPMTPALDVLVMPINHITTPDEWHGTTEFYFDVRSSVSYKSSWRLKTQQGAFERQKRETIEYLKELRKQIDDVLEKIDTREMDEHGLMAVESYMYTPRVKRSG